MLPVPVHRQHLIFISIISNAQAGEAKALYMRSARIKETMLGPDTPALTDVYYNLAQLSMEGADMKGAYHYISLVHEIGLKAFGPDHPLTQEALEKKTQLKRMI